MERVLAAKVYGSRFGVIDEAFVLTGGTRTGDLPTQLQVLAAYVSEPGWREEAFTRIKASSRTIHDQYESTDDGVLARDLSGLLHAGDHRWTFPSREEMADGRLAALKSAVEPDLTNGPVEVVIVGDVKVDDAIAAAAATFGALPARRTPDPAALPRPGVAFPAGGKAPVVLTHKGRADQAIGYIAWPATDFWADPQQARATAVMREVLKLRLLDELREAQGATYSPNVGSQHSQAWSGWGYIAASVEVPPEKVQAFFDDAAKIAQDLRTKEIDADELARARTPRVEALQKAQVTNGYWLGELSGAQADPRRLDAIRETVPGAQRVTAADVRRSAEMWLKPETAFRLIVEPAKGPAR
jgi:zinc protease